MARTSAFLKYHVFSAKISLVAEKPRNLKYLMKNTAIYNSHSIKHSFVSRIKFIYFFVNFPVFYITYLVLSSEILRWIIVPAFFLFLSYSSDCTFSFPDVSEYNSLHANNHQNDFLSRSNHHHL